jgi:ADP-ribose pyrophosphatase
MGRFPKRLSRRVIYRNPWLDLYVDKVRFPAGRLVDHHFVHFARESVATILEDKAGRIPLVRSYRYITRTLEWELPGGVIDRGEGPVEASRRETREETGFDSTDHRLIYTFYPVSGISNKVFHVVHARAGARVGDVDANEIESVRWYSRAQLERLVRANRIRDGYTLAGLLAWFLKSPARRTSSR